MGSKTIRIAGASGFWGDASMSTPQLLHHGQIDYIVYDYLAEITMSIMARARAKSPETGFAADFVSVVMKQNLQEIARQNVKILSNAGGINPSACGAALRDLIKAMGLDLKVAVIAGDDLLLQKEALAQSGISEMFSGESFPDLDKIASINAYLGGFPVAAALKAGADIVITGRSVDSAVTLGACIYEYGWGADDLDKLAGGSLAGHILECGPQATGGNFTDWHLVADQLDEIGYPIAIMHEDGSFEVTKPDNTGGIVNKGTIAEQMLYEIGDPQAYILPDVICDFSEVEIRELDDNLVRVTSAKGRGVPDSYKASLTYQDGFRGGVMLSYYGMNADQKARAMADAVLKRARNVLRQGNLADFSEVSLELIGAESQFGDYADHTAPRELVAKLAVKHPDAAGIGILLREASGMGLATPPGLCGFVGGRPKPSPLVRLFSMLVPKSDIDIRINIDEKAIAFTMPKTPKNGVMDALERPTLPALPKTDDEMIEVPLIKLAWGRSGDKGDKSNIGIIARNPAYMPYIWAALNEESVKKRFAHFLSEKDAPDAVQRFYMPGCSAMNILMDKALGGGGVASLRNDPQGKGYAQILLTHPVAIYKSLVEN